MGAPVPGGRKVETAGLGRFLFLGIYIINFNSWLFFILLLLTVLTLSDLRASTLSAIIAEFSQGELPFVPRPGSIEPSSSPGPWRLLDTPLLLLSDILFTLTKFLAAGTRFRISDTPSHVPCSDG